MDAQAFGEGQEHHVLQPVLQSIQSRYQRLNIHENLYQSGTIITADTGYANEANMQYLHDHGINGYIPDNQFRSRDPAQPGFPQHPQRSRSTGLLLRPTRRTENELYGLDETPHRLRQR